MLAAGLTTFASNASERGDGFVPKAGQEKVDGARCFLFGCYDENGKRVDKLKTASVAGAKTGKVKSAKASANDRYGAIIAKHAGANDIPIDLARAIIRIESNFRANARGRAGEVGLMQIKPATARSMGYSGSVKGLYNPETNIKYGMKYLGMAQKLGGGSVCGTILKYNAGHGAKRMNRISAAYCGKVKKHLGLS